MRILHTSDWHLGRNLYGRKRYSEFEAFLDWLYQTIITENIDTLLICGDIFDTNTPSNKAQELYYKFLCQVSLSQCKDIIIIAGNHDSPTFLEAPKNLLNALNIHVIGTPDVKLGENLTNHTELQSDFENKIDIQGDKKRENDENWYKNLPKEIILLKEKEKTTKLDKSNKTPCLNPHYQGIICAVPYLRDRDIRQSELGESFEQKNTKLLVGIQQHYAYIAKYAQTIQEHIFVEQGIKVPIIALGHLFAAGGITLKGDGVRDLYVGSLASIGADCFSPIFDYVALGHLHIEQMVNHNDYIRYSGSPIPMSFGEATQTKKIYILAFNPTNDKKSYSKSLSSINVPIFQKLMQIRGDLPTIKQEIANINTMLEANTNKFYPKNPQNKDNADKNAYKDNIENKEASLWLEVEYTGSTPISNLREELETCIIHANVEILRIRNSANYDKTLRASQNIEDQKSLHDLSLEDVFEARLKLYELSNEEKDELRNTYQEILRDLQELDLKAE